MINYQYPAEDGVFEDAVGLYLETKRITESDVLGNGSNSLTQTPIKMLESSVLEYHTSQNNTYIYSCSIQSVPQMDAEFVRLQKWIHEMDNAKFKQELSPMLFPVFCHLYLDAISDGNSQLAQAAVVFFKRHQSLFTSESLRDIIKDIGSIFKKEEIDSKPLVKAFRSAKCELTLSTKSATILKNFISDSDEPMILLNVLNSWFVMEDRDNNVREDDDPAVCPESEIMMGRKVELSFSPEKINYDYNESSDSEKDEFFENRDLSTDGMKSLISTFKNLRTSAPEPMPLLLLQMHYSNNSTCASVCYSTKSVAVGSLNAELKLFSFSEEKIMLPKERSLLVQLDIPKCEKDFRDNDTWSERHYSVLRGHTGSISAVKLLRNPNIILSTSDDKTLKAWRRDDFSCAAVYKGHNSPIWALDVSALNMYVATGSRDKTARLWTLDKTYPLRLYVGHYSCVNCVKFHPNGVYLGTGSSDKTVRLFSVIDGKTARLFTGHTGPVHCLSFSPNGQFLASAGDCKEVIVWNLALGQQYMSVDTDSFFVSDLSWNSDSSVLAITFLKQHISLLYVRKTRRENEHEIIGKYDLPQNRFVSCQYTENNNLIAVSVI
ncbi:hypothetical protein V9T40_003239 [Parthenolecanium corni]|uniref:TFIID subunit TAF5 NTD2 domain-containing protein n=1 Tax=Parthenolecanium corni TaxID=536013 RepID=A0AAN9TQB3_9HEMI